MIESIAFALLLAGLFHLLARLARRSFDRNIASPPAYAAVIVCGFLLAQVLPGFDRDAAEPDAASGPVASAAPRGGPEAAASGGGPAVVPSESARGEGLRGEPLSTAALRALEEAANAPPEAAGAGGASESSAVGAESSAPRPSLPEARAFLSFGAELSAAEATHTDAEVSDHSVQSLIRVYEYGRAHEGSMTDQAMIDLAEQLRRLRPAWWAQFGDTRDRSAAAR